MDIYKDELDIAELILANRSVSCAMMTEPLNDEKIQAALASLYSDTPNTKDLFYTKSIFVTTNKNKNDDVFLPEEVWLARKTPVDKMWNIDHNHTKVVGHITSSWCIDVDGNILEDDITEIPDLFHLCTGGVVYKKWQDPDMQEMVDELFEEIEAGEYCTSMEAFFSGISYLLEKDGETKIIDRDETTSFLTKHLRAYGGSGEFDGYKLGRVLRGIIFGGNAFTKNPANPDSIILAKQEKKPVLFSKSGVTTIKEEMNMSDNILEKQVAELKDQIQQLTAANKSLSDELAAASVERYEAELKALRDQVTASQKALDECEDKVKAAEAAQATIADQLKLINDEYVAVKAQLEETKKNATLASRTARLIEVGLAKEDAEAKAVSLVALTDEQFDGLAGIIASVKPQSVPGTQEPPVVPQSTQTPVVSGSELENSEEEDGADLTVASETSEEWMALANYFDKQLSKEKN